MATIPSHADYIHCQNLLFDWAESYDNKDWTHLASLLGPLFTADYTAVGGEKGVDVPSAAFVDRMSKSVLSNAAIKTQHLIGAVKWTQEGQKVIAKVQNRVWHKKEGAEVMRGLGFGMNVFEFEAVEEVWKIRSLTVGMKFGEYDLMKIFAGAA